MNFMFSNRRIFAFVLAAAIIILLYQFNDVLRDLSQQTPPLQLAQPHVHLNLDDVRWNGYEAKYTIQSLIPLPTGKPKILPRIQHNFGSKSAPEKDVQVQARQQKVKDVFTKCWQSYRTKAWMHDELSPISGTPRDTFGGWAATLVDSLDTLWIMDLKDEFKEAATAARSVNFSTSTDETVNTFETTIRYLGGFLAAYDLSGDVALLQKAVEVGEMLLVAFDTPNHMPISRWDWKKAANGEAQSAHDGILVSEVGSFSLEFTRLSQLTGDPRWYDAIQRVTNLFDAQQEKTKLPGMWPVVVNARDEDLMQDTGFTLGGMSDSLYEYLSKEYALLGGLSPVYQKLHEDSMSTVIEHLLFRPLTPGNKDILMTGDVRVDSDNSAKVLDPRGQHLGCFAGGMFALGGRLFSNEQHVSIGRKLTDGCIWAYEAMAAGVMPEIAHFTPCNSQEDCSWDATQWEDSVLERAGSAAVGRTAEDIITERKLPPGYVSIDDGRYILRPEAIESVLILFRVTGDDVYREAAWSMFNAILNISETSIANAALQDVTTMASGELPPKDDRMESFWLAETLKYFYLIFSSPDVISLDDYVLNTEAHPLRRPT